MNYFTDNPDLQWYLNKGVDWADLVSLVELNPDENPYESTEDAREMFESVLEMVGEFAGSEIAPRAAAIDKKGMKLVDGQVVFPRELDEIMEGIQAMDVHGMCAPRELGGANLPLLIYMMTADLFSRADVSVMTHHSFHGGMAMAMLLYSLVEGTSKVDEKGIILETRFGDAIGEIIRGEAWGSMDLTEPDAGSDLGALRAKGVLGEDGIWRVTGQKIFITSGHAKYHFVIARTDGAGLEGLSLFLVDASKGGVSLPNIEEKIGHHGSATVTVDFEEAPGELIGERGAGFKQMLLLMNGARIGVGFEGIGISEAATRMATEYAMQRPSMGKTIDRHEMIADYLDEMRTETDAVRALGIQAAIDLERFQRYRMLLMVKDGKHGDHTITKGELKKLEWSSRLTTPLLKYIAAENAVKHARMAIQIHGGVGYTQEYGAEKLLRDALVLPIYEGTSQIQSLMAMKDALGLITQRPKDFIRDELVTSRRMLTGEPVGRAVARVHWHALQAQQHLMLRVAGGKLRGVPPQKWGKAMKHWDVKTDFAFAMMHAERLTQILADDAICRVLYHQTRLDPARAGLLERYLERAEPRCRHLLDRIKNTGDRILHKLAEDTKHEEAAK